MNHQSTLHQARKLSGLHDVPCNGCTRCCHAIERALGVMGRDPLDEPGVDDGGPYNGLAPGVALPAHIQRAKDEVDSWPPERLNDLRLQGEPSDGVAPSLKGAE